MFFNLSILNIEGCCIDDLVLFNDNLNELYCSGGIICNLEFYGQNLQILDCSNNHINKIFVYSYYYYDYTIPNVIYFNGILSENNYYRDNIENGDIITHYSYIDAPIEILDCSYNNIQYLELGHNYGRGIKYLGCNNNKIQYLKFNGRTIEVLNCSNNKIKEMTGSIGSALDCHNNKLEVLNEHNYRYLNCSNNNLTDIPFGNYHNP